MSRAVGVHRSAKARTENPLNGSIRCCGTCEFWRATDRRKGKGVRLGACNYKLPACVRAYDLSMWDDEGQDCETWGPK